MRLSKYIIILCLSFFLTNCGNNSNTKTRLSINTNTKTIALGDTLNLSINNPKKLTIENVSYKLNGKSINAKEVLTGIKLGKKQLSATVTYNGKTENISKTITVFNANVPELYTYEILNTYPHDPTSYTQGLEFYNGELYESTGQRKQSKLRKVNFETGEVLKNINLDNAFFGEGITLLNDKIYQLTWEAGMGFVYDVNTFEKLSSFKYENSIQGWGLCNDGEKLYKSDGTNKIWALNTDNLTEENSIQVYTEKAKIDSINELEWVDGKIYANVYTKNVIAIINPNNGALDGILSLAPLNKLVTVKNPELEVLNGIAYYPERKTFFVTGKNWDKLFEVRITKK